MPDDNFFELYKINIACYYNSKLILKIINDDSSNISPTVIEMIGSYESNSEKIKKFDNEVYNEHYKYVKTILCKLFSEKEEPSSLFKNLRSEVDGWTKKATTKMIPYIQTFTSGASRMLTNATKTLGNRIPTIPNEEALTQFALKSVKLDDNSIERKKNKKRIQKRYESFLELVAKEVFLNNQQ